MKEVLLTRPTPWCRQDAHGNCDGFVIPHPEATKPIPIYVCPCTCHNYTPEVQQP